MVTTVKPKQKVTTYRDFMASRGYLDSSRYLMPARPLILPFEFNEEEEREISEAIAREEELMRLEEENKSGGHGNYDNMGFQSSRQFISTDVIKQHPYVSNLLPSVNDTPDDKIIKQVLDIMFSQVCRWDKQYGWAKMHMKRARQKTDTEKIHLRKIRLNQREILLSEHIDRLKKEINKRRTKMENEAEQQCGLLTPWRKARSRPQKSSKQPKTSAVHVSSESHAKKEVLNPADITLGGDTFDYGKEEEQLKTEENAEPQKEQTEAQQQNNIEEREKRVSESDSIASGVARRRRTSKSDDDSNKTTRGTKERRLSESQNEESFGVKNDSMSDESRYAEIDKSILHCVCQKLYDSSKFYMACDMCSGWFHGECVAITEEQTKNMSSWTCQKCFEEERAVKDQPQLYCLCRTPYDNTKFYVGCDACQGWFHPECVKITAAAAEAANEYICPNCAENETQKGYESSSSEGSVTSRASSSLPLDRNDYSHVMQLLELLLEHRMSSPFRQPVNIMEFPDYLQVISKPMDLSTISLKVDNLDYTYLRDFVADVNLMFENAKKYNPQDHAVFKCAETMQEVFERRLMDVRDSIKQNHTSTNRKRLESVGNNTLDGSLDIETDQLLSIDPKTFSMYDY